MVGRRRPAFTDSLFRHRDAVRRCLAVALAVTVLVGVTRATLAPPRPHTTVSVAEPTTGATLGVVDPSSSTAPIDSTSLMAVPTSTVRRLASTSVPLKAPASIPQATVPPTTAPAPAVPTLVQPGIYVIRIDGTGLRRLSGNAIDPSWAPNGQEVAYETLSPHTITIASLSGATRTLPGYLNGSMTPVWSPDSTQIEFAAAGDHVVQHGIQRKLILAGPASHQLPDPGAMPPDEE